MLKITKAYFLINTNCLINTHSNLLFFKFLRWGRKFKKMFGKLVILKELIYQWEKDFIWKILLNLNCKNLIVLSLSIVSCSLNFLVITIYCSLIKLVKKNLKNELSYLWTLLVHKSKYKEAMCIAPLGSSQLITELKSVKSS